MASEMHSNLSLMLFTIIRFTRPWATELDDDGNCTRKTFYINIDFALGYNFHILFPLIFGT